MSFALYPTQQRFGWRSSKGKDGMSTVRLLVLTNTNSPSKRSLERLLERAGYGVYTLSRNDDVEKHLADSDAILIEIGINEEDFWWCRSFRHGSYKPVVLYGRDVPSNVWVQGLRQGADAFLSLSMEQKVLLARLQAVLRRAGVGLV